MKKSKKFLLSGKGKHLRLRPHILMKENPLYKRSKELRSKRPRRRKRSKNPKFTMPTRRIKGRRKEKRTRMKRKWLMWR
jgi:hypothetical protein